MNDEPFDFGPVYRWRRGSVLFAENAFIKMAYAVTPAEDKIGDLGCCEGVYVVWIAADAAKAWNE